MDKMELKMIKMEDITKNKNNTEIFNMENIEHLANIIKEEGFSSPIEVFALDNGKYEISAGHRRYEAMKLLNAENIPCIIKENISKEDKTKRLISSNVATRQLTPMEMSRAIEAYKKILSKEKYKGDKRTKIAEYFNISESNVYRYECLLKLIPELQVMADRPQFPYSAFRMAANLSKEDQQKLYFELERLEKEERGIDTEENVDITEIKLTRVRIEQIINGLIKTNEKRIREQSVIENLDEIISNAEEPKSDINNLIVFETNSDEPIIDFDKKEKESDNEYNSISDDTELVQLLNFYERELNKIRERKYKIKNKKDTKIIIQRLRDILDTLEKEL